MKTTIQLFMWGYQPHFRHLLERRAKDVFEALGVDVDARVLLVGARKPSSSNPNQVCVEPEDGQWPVELFDQLLISIEREYEGHELQNMFYGDQPSMDRKPEVMRRDSTRIAVRKALLPYDRANEVTSFCGNATLLNDYYVVPVIQVPASVFDQFPSIGLVAKFYRNAKYSEQNLVRSAMAVLLHEASEELANSEAGSTRSERIRQPEELVRSAATNFMFAIAGAVDANYQGTDLFERLNAISSLMYEGAHGIGSLVLSSPENPHIAYTLRFRHPVPFREHRWVRKVLEMASEDACLIADSTQIFGLGRTTGNASDEDQPVFEVHFLDHFHWELQRGPHRFLRARYGKPQLPQEPVSKSLFALGYLRIFPSCKTEDVERIWNLFIAATRQGHGCMIVVALDAKEESERLAQQGTGIEPTLLTEGLLRCVSGIDGSIIVDPEGICYSIGVILDGPARPECTPSRGSRFNSALRYVRAATGGRMAIVLSDDHTVDIIPRLRPSVSRTHAVGMIEALEHATLDDYRKPRNWLDDHRFYLDDEQCARINIALDRIESLPREVGQLVITTTRFRKHPEMNSSYLTA
jgi:hypothetical protein